MESTEVPTVDYRETQFASLETATDKTRERQPARLCTAARMNLRQRFPPSDEPAAKARVDVVEVRYRL